MSELTKIQQKAMKWFHANQREMPWRDNPTPYRVWISEIMLQQTTVATVHHFFLRFMEKFPSLEILAQATEEDVLKQWAGLGYYSRARNILKTAQYLQKEENFPTTKDELLALSGIGPYTSAAISSIAFQNPDALVDTNVDRVLGRYHGLKRTQKDFDKTIRYFAQQHMDNIAINQPYDIRFWNQCLMEIGALLCSSTKVNCQKCPLKERCLAYASQDPLQFPGDKNKAQIIEKQESVLILSIDDKIVLSKNISSRRKGLYDFKTIDHDEDIQLGVMTYRISNDKIFRNIFCKSFPQYQLADGEVLVTAQDALTNYPLTSPCKKIIQKYLIK